MKDSVLPSTVDIALMMGGRTLSFPVTTEVGQEEVIPDDLCLSCPVPDIAQMQGCLAGTTNRPDYFSSIFFIFPDFPTYRITESQNSRGWKAPLWVI